MADDLVTQARALLAAATPGPWRWGDWSATFGTREDPRRMCQLEHNPTTNDSAPCTRMRGDGAIGVLRVDDPVDTSAHDRYAADARLIAAAPTLLEQLCERVEQLEQAAREMVAAADCSADNSAANWKRWQDALAALRKAVG